MVLIVLLVSSYKVLLLTVLASCWNLDVDLVKGLVVSHGSIVQLVFSVLRNPLRLRVLNRQTLHLVLNIVELGPILLLNECFDAVNFDAASG